MTIFFRFHFGNLTFFIGHLILPVGYAYVISVFLSFAKNETAGKSCNAWTNIFISTILHLMSFNSLSTTMYVCIFFGVCVFVCTKSISIEKYWIHLVVSNAQRRKCTLPKTKKDIQTIFFELYPFYGGTIYTNTNSNTLLT